jgi:uncharacterized membrane protein required for colicin V production
VNVIDIVFLVLFIVSLAVGFFQGMIRLAVLLVAMYLSLVLASLYYAAVGQWLVTTFQTQPYIGKYVGFVIVFFFGFLLLAVAGLYTFRYAHMPGGLRYLDHIGGVLLGMLLGAFFIGTFAAVLYNLMVARNARAIDFPLMGWLGDGVNNSFLVRYFAGNLLTMVYTILDPVLPDGAKLIFVVQ